MIAKDNFLREGKDVVVVYVPTDEDQEKAQKEAQKELESKCALETAKLMSKNPEKLELPPLIKRRLIRKWGDHLIAKDFVNSFCNPPVVVVNRPTERLNRRTRRCEEEKVTNQFVCEESKTNKDELSLDEWGNIKVRYSYFRY